MDPERWQQVDRVFQATLDRAPRERARFLARACAGDLELRSEVESLLSQHEQAGNFIESPAYELGAELLADTEIEDLAGNAIAGYQITALLGKGGMGEIYLALDKDLRRKVALKVLPGRFGQDDEQLRRFEQEARAASALSHPNVAHIYGIGETGGRHYIAMEYVEGQTLRARFARGRVKPQEAVNIATQCASALAVAHASGIVHRDIKPENVMVRPDGLVKVLDFGLAKLTEEDPSAGLPSRPLVETEPGVLMGTFSYMSPEQARGLPIDERTDIWSLGVVIYEMIAGRAPFEAETRGDVLAAILDREPAPLSGLSAQTPVELQRIVKKALNKDRESRYQTAKDIALDLDSLRREIDSQTGIGSGVKVERQAWLKRHKRAAVVAALVLVVAGLAYELLSRRNLIGGKSAGPFKEPKMTKLTSTGKVFSAAISPDARYMIYSTDEAGRQSVNVKQIATSSDVQIVPPTNAIYHGFRFTRDGNYVYFNKGDMTGIIFPDSSRYRPGFQVLYRTPSFGGPARKIVENLASPVTLSPDEQQIAFIRGYPRDNETSLIVAGSDGGGEHTLATRKVPNAFSWETLAWSPDGKGIACLGRPEFTEISLNGGAEKPIAAPSPFFISGVQWLPDASGLILRARRSGWAYLLWYLSYPGGEARRITNDLDDYTDMSLSADAGELVAVRTDREENMWVAPDGVAGRAREITFGTAHNGGSAISWTPDGRIVYDSDVTGYQQIWTMDIDGRNPRQLTEGRHRNVTPRVSPDGRYIAFASSRSGTQQIWRMDIDGANPKQLTEASLLSTPPCFSPDGRWVFYTAAGSACWRAPIDGGDPVLVADGAAAHGVSEDGKLVACHRLRRNAGSLWTIMLIPFEGGPPIKTFEVRSDSLPVLQWKSDARALIYSVTRGGPLSGVTNLWIQPLDGTKPRQLTNFDSGLISGFSWSRDGKQLAYVRVSYTSDAVLISNVR